MIDDGPPMSILLLKARTTPRCPRDADCTDRESVHGTVETAGVVCRAPGALAPTKRHAPKLNSFGS